MIADSKQKDHLKKIESYGRRETFQSITSFFFTQSYVTWNIEYKLYGLLVCHFYDAFFVRF